MEVIAFTVRNLKEKQMSYRMQFKASSVILPEQLQLKKKMSDNEDDEASNEGEDIIKEFDSLNFNEDNNSNFTWTLNEPDSRKR